MLTTITKANASSKPIVGKPNNFGIIRFQQSINTNGTIKRHIIINIITAIMIPTIPKPEINFIKLI